MELAVSRIVQVKGGHPVRSTSDDRKLDELVLVHMRAFPGFFLTCMGKQFLKEYYRSIALYNEGILLTAELDGHVVGFAAGFMSPPRFHAFLRSRIPQFLIPAVLGIIRRPSVLGRFMSAYSRTGRRAGEETRSSDGCELASLGVSPEAGGRGVGKILVTGFCEEARAKGAVTVCLTTDANNNDRVNRFYRSLGFTPSIQEERNGERIMQHYARDLDA